MSGFARLLAVQPQLLAVRTAGAALDLLPHELLHAGPPLGDPCRPPPVLLSSAVVTALHEGWATDAAQVESMVNRGEIRLSPAQSRACVVPLAGLVSCSTPLFVVGDGHGLVVHAPVSTVRGADTRMGNRDTGLASRLQLRDQQVAPAWQTALLGHGPLALLPLAAVGLAQGDDLHSRTTAANLGLAGWLRQHASGDLAAEIEATPLFFLTLWMAACALMLRSGEHHDPMSLVTRAGGNGEQFGIALAGQPDRWTCVAAAAPAGRLLGHVPEGTALCGAVGDSAVIDMLGCGGMALADAAEPLQAFAGFLPDDHANLASRLLGAHHPQLGRRVGLDARQVVEHGAAPLIALAMLAADGRTGFAGRGLYRPPVGLFKAAIDKMLATAQDLDVHSSTRRNQGN